MRDPLARELADTPSARPRRGALAPALLAVHSIFGALGSDPRMRSAVTEALTNLSTGARQTVQTFRAADWQVRTTWWQGHIATAVHFGTQQSTETTTSG